MLLGKSLDTNHCEMCYSWFDRKKEESQTRTAASLYQGPCENTVAQHSTDKQLQALLAMFAKAKTAKNIS